MLILEEALGHRCARAGKRVGMFRAGTSMQTREALPEHEQKRVALGYLNEAWAEALHEGIDSDCLAQACLFAAFAELVATYGEDASATFAEGLPKRIRNGEFTVEQARQ